MKGTISSALLGIGIIVAAYAGSYFLTVSPLEVGVGSGGWVRIDSVVPAYWGMPTWLRAPAFYRPLHFLDEKYVRPLKWKPNVRRTDAQNHGAVPA